MGKLFVISGASGVGKGTVLKQVMERRSDLSFSVSATTRPPRPGEIDGFHYYFISKEQFEEMIREDAFLEYDAHNANYYGTPMAQLNEKLHSGSVLLDIEPVGAKNVKQKREDAVLIFLCRLLWRNWNAGSGAGVIPPTSRSKFGWNGQNGSLNSAPGTITWLSTTILAPAWKKF